MSIVVGKEVIVKDKDLKGWLDRITELKQENKSLKESLDIATKCSCKEEDGIIRLSEENKMLKEVYEACNLDSINKAFKVANLEMENEKLKEELEFYKKQYEHSMGED